MKLEETDDMRAPLAFLLGKLHFDKEFRNLQAQPEGADTRITAEPKTRQSALFRGGVRGDARRPHPRSEGDRASTNPLLDFHFRPGKLDPQLDAKLFQFQVPKGAELVEEASSSRWPNSS